MRVSSFSSLSPQPLRKINYKNNQLLIPHVEDQLHFSGKKRARETDDETLESPIFKAARLDRVKDIAHMLDKGLSLEGQKNADEMTPLMVAAKAGNLAAVKFMLPHMSNLQQQDSAEKTALHHAVEQNHLPVVAALVAQHANRHIEDHENHTPITQAAKLGNIEALRILCKENADVNPFPIHSKARNPLTTAIQNNKQEAATFLLSQGANPDGIAGHYTSYNPKAIKTPLMTAADQNHPELIDLLVEHGAELELMRKGLTALAYAAHNRHWESVQKLLERNARVAPAMEDLQELMAEAAENEELSKLCFLLQHGVELEQAPACNRQVFPFALQVATLKNDVDSARILLNHGVTTDVEEEVKPALILAAENGYERMVKLLLAHGVDIDTQNESDALDCGETALHAAAKNNHLKLTEFLLNKGADLKMSDGDGRTAFTHAIEGGHNDLAKMLHTKYDAQMEWDFEANRVETPPLLAAAKSGNEEMLDYMIQAGVRVDTPNSEGVTPLMVAKTVSIAQKLYAAGANIENTDLDNRPPLMHQASAGHTGVINFLLSRGARMNDVDDKEQNALMAAAQSNEPSAVQVLLNRHPAPAMNRVDQKGNTAPIHALKGESRTEDNGEKNRVEILKALIDKGEDIHAFNLKNKNALMVAAGHLQPDSVEFLLKEGAKPQPRTSDSPSALTLAATAALDKTELSKDTLKVLRLLIQADPGDARENSELSRLVRQYAKNTDSMVFGKSLTPIEIQEKWESTFKALKRLIETGAKPSLGQPEICRALNYAARQNESEKVEFLLKNGLPPDGLHRSTRTPLMNAAKYGHTRVADILLEYGADPNSSNTKEETPFNLAAKGGCFNTMLRLLQAGADPAPHISIESKKKDGNVHPKEKGKLVQSVTIQTAEQREQHRKDMVVSWPTKLKDPEVADYVESLLGTGRADGNKITWNLQTRNRKDQQRYAKQDEDRQTFFNRMEEAEKRAQDRKTVP